MTKIYRLASKIYRKHKERYIKVTRNQLRIFQKIQIVDAFKIF